MMSTRDETTKQHSTKWEVEVEVEVEVEGLSVG